MDDPHAQRAHFTPLPYIPDQHELDSYVKRKYEKLTHDFIDCALRYNYPKRYWKTYAALLWISEGRPSFPVSRELLVHVSNQHIDTVKQGTRDLIDNGWITRKEKRRKGSSLSDHSIYGLPHLTQDQTTRRKGVNYDPHM